MKRPVTLALVATLLASTSAFAAGNPYPVSRHVAQQVVRNDDRRGDDRRGDDRRGDDHRGHDRHDNDRHDFDRHDNDRHDNDRHDWNDHRDDRRYDRPRNDDHRRDWNDHRDSYRNDHRNWNDHDRNDHRGWDRPRNDWSSHPHYWDNRSHDRRDYARYRFHNGYYRAPYGYQYRSWHRGDYLPRSYYDRSYIVYDWRPYRLYEPPYGYHWVRVGNDVLLTALATGVVLDVLYDIWY
jgi:Ni/Co efflux regulator RcnB